jgi:hypothetical protein
MGIGVVADRAPHTDPLAGAALYADVERYAALGIHRYGYDGDSHTTSWIARALTDVGYATSFQPFTLKRQYFLDAAHIEIANKVIDALPLWWISPTHGSFSLAAPFVVTGDAAGKLVWVKLPFDRQAYLNDTHRAAIAAAATRAPTAIIVTIDNPADEIFAYNVTQEDPPWPVPVIVVAAKHRDLLAAAEQRGDKVSITVNGRYGDNVTSRNVVARLDRGAKRTIVVSTPLTGWFVSTCERGPGIANFLALARWAVAQRFDVNFVFVGTTGHEIGHGGMEVFLGDGAPPPEATLAWIHFGASNASYEWERTEQGFRRVDRVDAAGRLLVLSHSLAVPLKAAFEGVQVVTMDKTVVGELREVKAAGYPDFFGMAGPHHFFHTPCDTLEGTGPDILEPVARAFARAVEAIVERSTPRRW